MKNLYIAIMMLNFGVITYSVYNVGYLRASNKYLEAKIDCASSHSLSQKDELEPKYTYQHTMYNCLLRLGY